MHCCESPTSKPAEGEGTGATPSSTGRRLKSGLLLTSCLWTMVGGLAFFAFAGPALGIPAYVASAGLVLLCPVSMMVMMATMGRHGHKHG